MTLLYAESFDDGHYARRYTTDLGVTVEAGIHGLAGRPRQIELAVDSADRDPTFIFGTFFRVYSGLYNGSIVSFLGSDGVTAHVAVALTVSGEITVTAGGAEIYRTGTNLLQVGVWRYIEMAGTVNDTTGEISLRVDGDELFSDTGIDTRVGGSDANVHRLRYGDDSSSRRSLFDDVYFGNKLGGAGAVNSLIGPLEIEVIRPNGNGNYSQLVGSDGNSVDNYLNVDETTPSAADYNGSDVVGNKDSYAMSDLVATDGTIHAVVQSGYALKSDAGVKSGRNFIRRSATDDFGPDHTLSESAILFDRILEQDPVAAGAWTIAAVNDTEFGWEVRT